MPAPLVAYAIGKGLEAAGLPSALANPKGYILDQLKGAVDSKLGLSPGTTNLVTDPKGAIKDAAGKYIKGKVREAYDADDSSMSAIDSGGGMSAMEYEGNYKRGGKVKSKASTASRRGDGIAQRGKTKGRYL